MAFASCGNAEQAEKELGYVATGIQRHIAYLEVWLSRMLVTDRNPAELSGCGIDFVPVALELWALIKHAQLDGDVSRIMILPTGHLLRDGYLMKKELPYQIRRSLISFRSIVPPRGEGEIRKAKADRFHRLLSLDLQKLTANIRLYERSLPTRLRLEALEFGQRRVRVGEKMIAFLEDTFGPFERVSGAEIDMSWWDPDRPLSEQET